MKNEDITIETLLYWEHFISYNEESFIKKFLKGDVMAITSISWNSENMKIVYVLNSGQHVADSKQMRYFLRWKEELDNV